MQVNSSHGERTTTKKMGSRVTFWQLKVGRGEAYHAQVNQRNIAGSCNRQGHRKKDKNQSDQATKIEA